MKWPTKQEFLKWPEPLTRRQRLVLIGCVLVGIAVWVSPAIAQVDEIARGKADAAQGQVNGVEQRVTALEALTGDLGAALDSHEAAANILLDAHSDQLGTLTQIVQDNVWRITALEGATGGGGVQIVDSLGTLVGPIVGPGVVGGFIVRFDLGGFSMLWEVTETELHTFGMGRLGVLCSDAWDGTAFLPQKKASSAMFPGAFGTVVGFYTPDPDDAGMAHVFVGLPGTLPESSSLFHNLILSPSGCVVQPAKNRFPIWLEPLGTIPAFVPPFVIQ